MNKELEASTTLSHYRILRKLGAGGMGEVYLAEDTKLKRKVALKVLPFDVASDEERMRRFTQEAEAAAALNHPAIAHVYEIGEGEGTHFIAMEYVAGVTLNEKIHREKTDLRRLLKYLIQIAEGLAKAHSAGIVHRDLKPDNIMISADGYAKVLDFGLAKLVEPQTSPGKLSESWGESETAILPQHSTPGMILGTLGYMSPEQAQGRVREIDHRSDIFSFGCILFEVATGRKAFAGKDALDSLHKIVHSPTPQIQDTSPDAPQDLQRIVRRCLQKEADKRYQSIKEVAIELEELRQALKDKAALEHSVQPESNVGKSAISSPQAKIDDTSQSAAGTTQSVHSTSSAEYIAGEIKRHKRGFLIALSILLVAATGFGYWFYANRPASDDARQINSIAVLPFENRSGNPDSEYLSDGLAESLIYRLSQLPNLKVSPTSAVFRYKGKETDAQKIAGELSVEAVMTGRMTQRGESLTISVELIDVRNNTLIWGEQYERKMSELLQTQREIAAEITNKLQLKLSGGEKALTKKYTDNNVAYQLYLKGRFYFAKRNPQDLQKAIEYFNQAVALDSNFALGYAGLADAYSSQPNYRAAPPREAMPKAKDAALKALSLDNTLAEAHAALGFILHFYNYDFAAAEREYLRAVELNPNYAQAHHSYGILLSNLGRYEECFARVGKALELDPLSSVINRTYGERLILARRDDDAIAQLKKTVEMDADFLSARYSLAVAFQAKGSYPEAVEEFAKYEELSGERQTAALMRDSYARNGWQGFMRLVAEKSLRFNSPWDSPAAVYAALGEKDKAFAELNKSYENRENIMTLIKVDPRLDPLRNDPRFKDLLRRMNLPE